MPPPEHSCSHRGTSFKHQGRLASPQKVRGGGEPDGACADDGDWQWVGFHVRFHVLLAFIQSVLGPCSLQDEQPVHASASCRASGHPRVYYLVLYNRRRPPAQKDA